MLVGNGNLALRYYNDVVKGKDVSAEYAGYAAQNPVVELPNYLGTVADLHKILEKYPDYPYCDCGGKPRTAASCCRSPRLQKNYGIKVSVIPVYSDFLSSRTMDNTVNGLYVIDLKNAGNLRYYGCEHCGNGHGQNHDVAGKPAGTMAWEIYLRGQCTYHRNGARGCRVSLYSEPCGHGAAGRRSPFAVQPQAGVCCCAARYGAGFDEAGFGGQCRKTAGGTIFNGSTPETLQLLRKKVEKRYPGVVISGMMSPPFREMTPQEDAQAVAEINATKPDFVWVGLGAPKQERWMAAHEDRVQALMIGVGAAFDYEAGNIKRAPMWMQKHNLEWLYRLMQDPKRLFHRYLKTNVKYLLWTWRSGE